MRTESGLVRLVILALIFTPLLNPFVDEGSSASMHGVQAQTVSPRWAIGQYQVQFPEPGSDDDLVETPLPIPDDPAAEALGLTYDGAAPTTSVHVQEDDQGDLLFFIVDGNVYDRWGYLIAPASTALNDHVNGLLWKGTGEVVAAPVPGRCGLWYLFHSRPLTSDGEAHRLAFSVLDLTIPNPSFPSDPDRWGILRSYENSTMPDFENGDFDLNPANEIPTISSEDDIVNGRIQMKAVHDTYTGRGFLLAATPYHLVKYELLTDEVRFLGSQFLPHYPDPDYQYEPQRAKGELEAFAENGQIRVAHSFNNLFYTPPLPTIPPTPAEIRMDLSMHFARFDANQPGLPSIGLPSTVLTGTIVFPNTLLDGQNDPITTFCIGGVEFSPNGRYTYFAKSFAGGAVESAHLAYWDWNSNTLTALVDVDLTNFLDSRMELNSFPAEIGSGDAPFAIYLSGTRPDGQHILGALKNPDQPANSNWVPEVFETSSITLCSDPSLNYTGQPPPDRYALIQKQGFDDQTLPMLVEADCCADVHAFTGFTDYTAEEGTAVWTTTSNPFQTEHNVRMNGTFTIPAGASVIANNMNFTFAPGATMVVERGGRFVSNGCTFTSGCEERWAGIRVEGKRNNPVQTQTGLPVNERQGWLYLTNSEVANAEIGVLCGRLTDPLSKLSMYNGGVVRASGTTFRNCITGVNIPYYKRMNGSVELDNLSNFSGCDFLTDLDWPVASNAPPMYHAWLSGVRGITFSQCRFRNDEPTAFGPYQRGWGIFAYQAGFNVLGNDDPDDSVFENLHIGIVSAPGPTKTYAVDQMHFQNNMWGIYDMGSTAGRIIRNTFLVPDQGEFLQPTVGLLLHESSAYIVEENDFAGDTKDRSVGIYFLGPQQADNRIYNNTFTQLLAGTLVYGRHKGNEIGFEGQGLEILCGDYLDNIFDYALAEYTYIKENQGQIDPLDPLNSQLAGNRWLDAADLTSTFDIWIDPDQHTGADPANPSPSFDYKRHDVAVCDPLNVSQYFVDEEQTDFDDFDKEVACGNGNLQPPPGPPDELYVLTAAQLISAISHFNGTVNDGGEHLDLAEAVTQRPPLASHVLRDYLLAHTPLHDDIMIAMLERETPMDAWHATQVLLANCKLSNRVWNVAKYVEYLSPYQLGLIENATDNTQALQLLVQEVALRSSQKARLQTHVMHALLSDSTTANRISALWDIVGEAPDRADEYYVASLHLFGGEESVVDTWLDSMETKNVQDVAVLRDLLQLRESTPATWPEPQSAHATVLVSAMEQMHPGSAMARAMGFQGQLVDVLPPVMLPDLSKSRRPARRSSEAVTSTHATLEVYPNPTNGWAYVVLPMDTGTGTTVTVRDALGRTVKEVVNNSGALLIELDLRELANGVYVCDVGDGNSWMNSTLITVKH